MDNQDNASDVLDMSGQSSHNLSSYALSVEQASERFITAGVPRSPRTIIRYCMQKHLDCIKVDTERNEKYLVSEESLETRIQELKQLIMSSHVETSQVVTGHDQSRPDLSRHNAISDEQRQALQNKIDSLEEELERVKNEKRDLEITNRVKDHVLKKAETELSGARKQLMRFNRAIGELVTTLRLKAPEHDTSAIVHYLDAPQQEDGGDWGDDRERSENFIDSNPR